MTGRKDIERGALLCLGLVLGTTLGRFSVSSQPESQAGSERLSDSRETAARASSAPAHETDATTARASSRSPLRRALPDGGAASAAYTSEPPTASQCLVRFFGDSDGVSAYVLRAHSTGRGACLRRTSATTEEFFERIGGGAPQPRGQCGDLDEELWSESNPTIEALLATALASVSDPHELDGAMFRDVDCSNIDESELGAMLHIAALAPNWAAPTFLECAVRRERSREDFPLWTLLDITARIPGSRRWLDGSEFTDPRTTRRLAPPTTLDGTRPRPDRPASEDLEVEAR